MDVRRQLLLRNERDDDGFLNDAVTRMLKTRTLWPAKNGHTSSVSGFLTC